MAQARCPAKCEVWFTEFMVSLGFTWLHTYLFPETKLEFGCVAICNPLLAIVQIIPTNCKTGNSELVHNSLCLL